MPAQAMTAAQTANTCRPARAPGQPDARPAGLVNNLNDRLAWGTFPPLFARGGLSVGRIGILVALYPAVWGVGQLAAGALPDRWGRR